LLRIIATTEMAMESGKWKGKEVPCSKAKERKAQGRVKPKKERSGHHGEEHGNCYRCRARGHWSHESNSPNNLLTFTNRARIQGNVNMSLTSLLSLKLCLRSTATKLLALVVEMSKWRQ
jgi:hypothetical protein